MFLLHALHYLYIHLEDKSGENFGIAKARRALREYLMRHYLLLPIHFLATYLQCFQTETIYFLCRTSNEIATGQIKKISARTETILQHTPTAADIISQREEGNQQTPRKRQKSSILDCMHDEHRRVAPMTKN